MPTAAELRIVIEAQDRASATLRGLGQDVSRLERRVEGAGGAFGRLGGAISGLGQLGLAAGGIGAIVDGVTRAAGAFGGIVQQASDLNEQISRSEQVFGAAAGSVQQFAQTTAQALGISRTEALEAAGSFGTLFRTAGLSAEATADMSTNLVRLAADLASFNNLDPSEALEKLRSGLAGEAEPLRTVGVLLSDAAVGAEALSLGLVQGAVDATKARAAQAALTDAQVKYNAVARQANATAAQRETAAAAVQTAEAALNKALAGTIPELTEAQKVQARYSLIMKQSATAQGDFARTSTGLANAQRILRASFADIQSELGANVLPVVARLSSAFARALPDALHAARGLVAAFTIDAGAMGNVLDALRRIFGDTVANAIQPFVHRFMEAIPAIRAFAEQVGQVGLAITQAFEKLRSGDLQGAWDDVLDLLRALGATLGPVLAGWTQAFLDWAGQVIPPLLQALSERLGDVWAWVRETAPRLLETAIGTWIPAFVRWVDAVGPGILAALIQMLSELGRWVRDTAAPQMLAFGQEMGAALVRGLSQALGQLGPAIDEALNQNPLLRAVLMGSPLTAGLLPGPRAAAAPVVSQAAAVAGATGRVHVEIRGVNVVVGMDPESAAREAGEAVRQEVYDALTASQAVTDPGAPALLAGAPR